MYLSSLVPEISPYDRIWSGSHVPREVYDQKILELSRKGFVDNNHDPQISFIGRDSIRVVLVGGVFDLIHPGHVHTLKAAKMLGDVLVVVIARTATAKKYEGKEKSFMMNYSGRNWFLRCSLLILRLSVRKEHYMIR